jgi:hypothetical protein
MEYWSMVDVTTASFKASGWKLIKRGECWHNFHIRNLGKYGQILFCHPSTDHYLNHGFTVSAAVWYIASLIHAIEYWTLIV